MAGIAIDYALPAPDLEPYITVFYRFVADVAVFEDVERADHAQFRFRLTPGEASYGFADGINCPASAIHILAATTGATRTRVDGPVALFGMGLTPAGWAAVLGPRAVARGHRLYDAAALLGPPVHAAATSLARASDLAAMVAIAEPFMRRLVIGGDPATLAFVRAVDGWLAGAASPDPAALAAQTQLSRRQIERRCNCLYGAPPKLLARKYRALRAAAALASGAATVDALLADGFYDQSHLIRELKQFTGLTPGRIRDDPGVLARLSISRRAALRVPMGTPTGDR